MQNKHPKIYFISPASDEYIETEIKIQYYLQLLKRS